MPIPSTSTRREFLRLTGQSLGLAALAGMTPKLVSRPSLLSPTQTQDHILVLIHLAGGNDGLNTLIPYTDDNYYRQRPRISIPPQRILKLNESWGLHPACDGLRDLYDNGHLSVVQNVGYPEPNRTHFGSNLIWATASLEPDSIPTGWLGRYLDTPKQSTAKGLSPDAIHFSSQTPFSLIAEQEHRIAKYDSANQTFSFASETTVSSNLGERDLRQFMRNDSYTANYPSTPFAANLQATAQMIGSGPSTQVYHLTLNGFDTHSHQASPHANVLQQLSDGLNSFQADLKQRKIDHKVLTVAYSEFGRRLHENPARGTDHGTSGPMLILGSALKGGIYGKATSLELPPYEDLAPTTDFRQVYVTLLEDWLHTPAAMVLGGTSTKLPIFS